MIKFIIALLAISPAKYIQYAQDHFPKVAASYILSDKASPHVTLAQFYGTPADYEIICKKLAQENSIPQPRFIGISFTKDKNEKGIWWADYAVARDDALMALQNRIDSLLSERHLKLINESRNLYRPHLTLARVVSAQIDLDLNDNIPTSTFTLVIGEADPMGQFVKLLKTFPETK